MNLKKNLTRLILSMCLVMFSIPEIYAQQETTSIFQSSATINNNDCCKEIGTSKVFASPSLQIMMSSYIENIPVNRDSKSQLKPKEFYLHKSKKQKITGWVLLGVGAGIASAGGIVGTNGDSMSSMLGGAAVALGGGVVCLSSIPFFISAHHNKEMASTLSFGTQNIYSPQNNSAGLNVNPALILKIRF